MNKLNKLLKEKGILLADGATGTNLIPMGLDSGQAPEAWNFDHIDRIQKLHQSFIDAGSDILVTNSFGGTARRLHLHDLHDRVVEINKAAAEIAGDLVAKSGREIVVAGSVGPTGDLLVPLGELTYEGAVEAFEEQMTGLKQGGVDVAWIETMSSPEEIDAAIEAANKVGLDYVVTASFDTAGNTMMGHSPSAFAGRWLRRTRVQRRLVQTAASARPICWWPQLIWSPMQTAFLLWPKPMRASPKSQATKWCIPAHLS